MTHSLDRRRFLRTSLAAATATLPGLRSAGAAGPGRALIAFQVPPVALRLVESVLTGLQARYRPDLGTSPVVLPGGSGEIAIDLVSRSPADGSTALILPSSLSTLVPNLHKASLDFRDRLVPVAGIGEIPVAVLVGAAVPTEIATLPDYLRWVRDHPAANRYGVPGLGTAPHFIGNELARLSELPLRVTGYKGTLALLKDIADGSLTAGIAPIPVANDDPLAAGIRVLAIAGPARWPGLPAVPTIDEVGFPVEAPVESLGFYLPAATPAEKVRELADAVRATVRDAGVVANMKSNGMSPMPAAGADYASVIAGERTTWASLVAMRNFVG